MHCATSNKHTCTRVALHARAAQAATARTESSDTRARRASFSTRAHNVARCAHASETACTRTRAHTLSPFSRSPCRLLSYQEKRGDSEQGDSERSSLQGEANSCGGSQGRRWAWARMQRAPAAPAWSVGYTAPIPARLACPADKGQPFSSRRATAACTPFPLAALSCCPCLTARLEQSCRAIPALFDQERPSTRRTLSPGAPPNSSAHKTQCVPYVEHIRISYSPPPIRIHPPVNPAKGTPSQPGPIWKAPARPPKPAWRNRRAHTERT